MDEPERRDSLPVSVRLSRRAGSVVALNNKRAMKSAELRWLP
jgi:hypothetical protein